MNLAMDATGKIFTANYPYPNMQCTVDFKCDADGSISNDKIIVVCLSKYNTYPQMASNTWVVSSLATSDLDIWYGQKVTVDISKLFSITNCSSNKW